MPILCCRLFLFMDSSCLTYISMTQQMIFQIVEYPSSLTYLPQVNFMLVTFALGDLVDWVMRLCDLLEMLCALLKWILWSSSAFNIFVWFINPSLKCSRKWCDLFLNEVDALRLCLPYSFPLVVGYSAYITVKMSHIGWELTFQLRFGCAGWGVKMSHISRRMGIWSPYIDLDKPSLMS